MPALRGPTGSIRYERDDLGYPSIEARSLEEASWARGWFHAFDRLVQVQLTLAVAEGRALELMGESPLARYTDRMTRLHRFTDDLDDQVARISPSLRPILEAYCAGFDAGARARRWPLLLRAARIPPRPYRPRDVILLLRIGCAARCFAATSLRAPMPCSTSSRASSCSAITSTRRSRSSGPITSTP